MLEKSFFLTGIGDVASAFSRDKKLFSQFFIFFQEKNLISRIGCGDGRHHSCGAAADYYCFHLIACLMIFNQVFDKLYLTQSVGISTFCIL